MYLNFIRFSALQPSTLDQSNQNWTTLNHAEITSNLQLKRIDVSDNNITELNSTIFSEHGLLEVFILSRNALYTFPQDLSFLSSKSLHRFECSACGISVIYKDTFFELPRLKELDLSHNKLSVIHAGAFNRQFYLGNLNFDFNKLKHLPNELLKQSAVNITLSMNNNSEFDFQPNEVFLKSIFLTEFQCSFCGITSIYEQTLSELPNLQKLFLNSNKISKLNHKMFLKNSNITTIFLEHNILSDIPMNVFDVIKKLKSLCIDGNIFVTTATNTFKKYYVGAKLRTNCTEVDLEDKKYFENELNPTEESISVTLSPIDDETTTEINSPVEASLNRGISDAFIASYLLIILVAQAAVIGLLTMYWFKIVLTDKIDEFDYSSNVLNDHDIYNVS